MENIETFLANLSKQAIKVWVTGEKLRCQAPKGLLTPILREQLSERKPEILRFFRQSAPITAVSRKQDLPLSFAQQRLWFLNQLEGASATYNVFSALQLTGRLHFSALEKSLVGIIQRHESLRTTFRSHGDIPVQIIHACFSPLTGYTAVQNLAEASVIIQSEIDQPFDLEKDNLIRTRLLKLSDREHILVITMHHITSDVWSMGLFLQELAIFYNALVRGVSPQLAPLAIQYADFAVWQRQWLQGETLDTSLNYWRKQLADIPPLLTLPTDFPRPSIQRHRGAVERLQLSVNLTTQLKALSQRYGVTLFMTLLSAFAVLLSRYSGQQDIVIGSPIANRTHPQIEPLIGFFVNTLALRLKLTDEPSFLTLLQQAKQVALASYAHQDIPFEQLVEALKPARSTRYSPLFQVMFALQNAPQSELNLSDLTLTPLCFEGAIAKFDLTLTLTETVEGLQGEWEYDTDLFMPKTMQQMCIHWQRLLMLLVDDPAQSVFSLSFLTSAEQAQFQTWNQTETDYDLSKGVHQLVAEQALRTPNAIAVIFDKQSLTYQALNQRADQLAHYLQTLGVVPNMIVGLCVERSLEMVIGLLGILKAGGAYLPLDPDYPAERLSFMLIDAQVSILLTQTALLPTLPSTRQTIPLDNWTSHDASAPINQTNASDLAYVIYTSGSTGQPKGVMISHRALTNHTLWMQETFPLSAEDKVLQKTPFSFDASVWEFYAPLIAGAQLVIAPPQAHRDGQWLIQILNDYQITVLQLVPSFLRILLQDNTLKTVKSLKRLFCGGEVLCAELVNACLANLAVTVINLYGPTEACIDSTYWQNPVAFQVSTVPVGRPIANVQTYILDRYQQPVPVGVAGELYIGGAGLATGYLNRPTLTAERFIFFARKRVYKTGDLARYLPDGTIEYLGRIDNQVKIRGFRIELGEIEAVLDSFSAVKESAVVVTTENPRLVAYLVLRQSVDFASLREFLQARLPLPLIPNHFIPLDSLPLTPSGKIDHRSLTMRPVEPLTEDTVVTPRNAEEALLADIWCEILQLDKVGIYDNFFSLGGHSLLALQMVSRLQTNSAFQLPVRHVFKTPTIAELARVIQLLPPPQGPSMNTDTVVSQIPSQLFEARQGFKTQLSRTERDTNPLPPPPDKSLHTIFYQTSIGKMAAYLTTPPPFNQKYPAIIWLTGGFPPGGLSAEVWQSTTPDQAAKIYYQNDILTMYPTLRGSFGNPGVQETFFGEVTDVLAAWQYLQGIDYVDSNRIFLGGHSTGGTLALLVATTLNHFRAIFAFGPVDDPRQYEREALTYNFSDPQENRLRAPRHFLDNILSPTFIIEGSEGNREAFFTFQQLNKNDKLHCLMVKGADHFNVLAPVNQLLAQKINALDAEIPLSIHSSELQTVFDKSYA